jgi:hypothetical protein
MLRRRRERDVNEIEEFPVPPGRGTLSDPFYYLNNFQAVVSLLSERYADLLSPAERLFIDRFGALPRASRALLVRMVMRQGEWFRCSRLKYPEIGEIQRAVAPLLELGWVQEGSALDVDQLQRLLTKSELLRYFSLSSRYQRFKKAQIAAVLREQYPESRSFQSWCKEPGDRLYHLTAAGLCERFRLMFFGNFYQDWTELVLAELGVFAYERIPSAQQSRPFRTRAHIDSFEQLYHCQRSLDAGLGLDTVSAAIPQPIADCDWLEDRRQKLLFYIARAYEQRGESTLALKTYSACAHRGARMRAIRIRERAHEWEIARNLCLLALKNPETEAERQLLRRLLPRLNRKLGVSELKPPELPDVPTLEMQIDIAARHERVEHCVRDRLARAEADSTVHYVENALVNSLFGLLCWKAIFAPIAGAFFHDYQNGPADLSSGYFYKRRQREFEACFAELESDDYKATIRRCYTAKAGIQSPFVAWGVLNERLLECALACLPASHLRLWFEWIVRDVQDNRAGFPDLVQFWPRERRYRMIEVKGPSDRLQDNQRRLLEFCVSHQMPVCVCYVR